MMPRVSVAETETENSKVRLRDTGNRTQDHNSRLRAIHPKTPPAKKLKTIFLFHWDGIEALPPAIASFDLCPFAKVEKSSGQVWRQE